MLGKSGVVDVADVEMNPTAALFTSLRNCQNSRG